jgi:hypothetical protein
MGTLTTAAVTTALTPMMGATKAVPIIGTVNAKGAP